MPKPPASRQRPTWGAGQIYLRHRTWCIDYHYQGKRYRESARSEDRQVAEVLLRERLAALHRFPQVRQGPTQLQIKTLLDRLLTEYKVHGRASLRTAVGHCRALEAMGLGERRPRDLVGPLLWDCIDAWKEAGSENATINRRLTTLRRALNLARRDKLLLDVDMPTIPRLPEDNVRQGFVSQATFAQLLPELRDVDLADAAEWAFLSSMRKGEIRALQWAWFDEETWALRLPKKPNSKRRRGRVIVLRGRFRAVIERRLVRRTPGCPYIFHRNGRPLGDWRKRWRSALKRAGLPPTLLFADFRRTGIRNFTRARIPRPVAMQFSGHLTESTYRRYDIADEEDLAEAAERLTTYLGDPPEKAASPPPDDRSPASSGADLTE